MDRYPPIADHGLIGDLQTSALVSSQGVVDWMAAPRFDSPSVFAALLDHAGGGYFRISPELSQETSCKQLYYPDTAVLVTRFMSPDGVGEVIDWMPPNTSTTPTDRHTLIRGVRAVRGTVRFTLECRPRFDYGRAQHDLDLRPEGAAFRAPGITAHLQSTFPLEPDGRDMRGEITLSVGETAAVVFTVGDPDRAAPAVPTTDGVTEQLWEVVDFWQRWIRTSNYKGRWPDMVHRSAITLKLLTYAPTGAPVAAATMGLPEQVGGERNWDYRYTWIRDGSLSVRALLDLGFVEEATAFTHWLSDRLREGEGKGGEPLQIMYRVDGEPLLTEEILDHWEGYRGSYPVRLGNAASDQLQLDIYGEAFYAISEGREVGIQAGYQGWKGLARTLDWLADNWDRPDEGIWETRGGRKDFTYSRVMCWAAFDRGLKLAAAFSRPADTVRWTKARDTILEQVMEKGWSEEAKAYVQHYGGDDVLDASLLLIPRVGFLAPRDSSWLSTLDGMERTLVSDSLVYRYDPAASPDGLKGSEGTFSLCTFLYVDALAQSGRLRQARFTFEKMHTYANHVGLFAEEVGPSGEQLGNFPQAFTHLSLIMAATTLDKALDQQRD